MKTNHSGRKTLVQKLQDNDVLPNQIVQVTGHKNLQSVDYYSSLRERQMENISKIPERIFEEILTSVLDERFPESH